MCLRARARAENNYTAAYEGSRRSDGPREFINSARKWIGLGISSVRIRYGYGSDRAQSDPLRLVFLSLFLFFFALWIQPSVLSSFRACSSSWSLISPRSRTAISELDLFSRNKLILIFSNMTEVTIPRLLFLSSFESMWFFRLGFFFSCISFQNHLLHWMLWKLHRRFGG